MKQIEFPRKLKIGIREYKIIIKDEVLIKKDRCFGKVNFETRTIELRKGWKTVEEALLHEVGHAFLYESKMADNTEQNAQAINHLLTQILQQIRIKSKKKKK